MVNLLITTLRESLRGCDLANSRLVVAVSGGPDSLALTLGLAELRPELGLELHLAHFDHQLRSDSGSDAAFVEAIGKSLGLPVTIGRGDVRRLAQVERVGLEEAARRARYRFLSSVRAGSQAAAVVVAHTGDDQTETRLMHWLRGSGLRGLVGMAEDLVLDVPGAEPVRLVRPLLAVRREDTEAFCRERAVEALSDPSNSDRAFTRNRIRHEILPSLRAINPRLDVGLARLARCAADTEQFVESELDRRWDTLVQTAGADWVVERSGWRGLPSALKRAFLLRAATAFTRTADGVDADNVEDALHATDSWPAGRVLTWPCDVELRVEHDRFIIRRRRAQASALATRVLPTSVERSEEFGPTAHALPADRGGVVRLRRVSAPCSNRRADRWHCDLDGAKLAEASSLVVRARQPGDWIMPEGMAGRKKVQDLLVDAHIPREDRDGIPIVATSAGVAWIVGVRRDRRFLADPNSHDVLCLHVEPHLGARSGDSDGSKETRCAT